LNQFGKNIKLASGNVCSRIIAVRINDLDISDTELLEYELGCRLRSIDFIYSSTTVNRPRKPSDNTDFIDAYNKGKFWINQVTPTPEGFEKGLKYLNEAISMDPTDPRPYPSLALGYSNAGHVSPAAADASNRVKAIVKRLNFT
jgi:hypothetical protein